MHQLKLDLKPKIHNLIINSMRGVSGSAPGMGAMTRMAGERKSQLFRGKGLEKRIGVAGRTDGTHRYHDKGSHR